MLSSNSGSRVRLRSLKKAGISTSDWYSSLGRWYSARFPRWRHLNSHTLVGQADTGGSVMLVIGQCGGTDRRVDEPLISHNLCLRFCDLCVSQRKGLLGQR